MRPMTISVMAEISCYGIAQSVYQRDTGWTAWVQFPAVQDFSLLHSKIDSGAHPDSYLKGTGGSFPGGKAAGV
jgi:hypothetical protein